MPGEGADCSADFANEQLTVSQETSAELGTRVAARAVDGSDPRYAGVSGADTGGGYVADTHSTVRFDEQTGACRDRSSPRSPSQPGLSMSPGDTSDGDLQALVIPPDATLVDGLRALLVHHLKRSVGSSIVSLSASQAELLEHHLARLASYAQKIVHTLAFATRFLSKQNEGGDSYPNDPQNFAAGGMMTHNPHYRGDGNAAQQQVQEPPKAPRKSLKLSDDEILSIYRSAQEEAATEADWRGIEGPAMNTLSSRSGADLPPPGSQQPQGGDHEYLKILSRALQEPGSENAALTAEILDPSKGVVCCRPGVPPMQYGGATGAGPPLNMNGGTSASSSNRNIRSVHQ